MRATATSADALNSFGIAGTLPASMQCMRSTFVEKLCALRSPRERATVSVYTSRRASLGTTPGACRYAQSVVDTLSSRRPWSYALFSIIAGAIGWFASFELLTERLKTLQDPSYTPNCDFSVLVTCGPNMSSWQGSLLGFSNTVIGVTAFVAPIIIGFALLARAQFEQWFWMLYQFGNLLGVVFITWLFAQSVFVLGTLCPWCLVVWAVMIPLWWINFFRPLALGQIRLGGGTWGARSAAIARGAYGWVWVIIVAHYLTLALIAQLRLNWVAELLRFVSFG